MKQILKKVFLPNEFDGVVLALGLCILGAITFAICQYGFDTFYDKQGSCFFFKTLVFGVFLGSLLAIGTIVADHNRITIVRVVLAIGITTSLAAYVRFSWMLDYWNSQDWEFLDGIESFSRILRYVPVSLLEVADWWVVLGIASLVIASLLGTMGTRYFAKLAGYVKKRLKVDRVKFMCAFAVGIGILALVQNIVLEIDNNGLGEATGSLFEKSGWLLLIPAGIVAILLGVAFPGYAFNIIRPGWRRGILACGYYLIVFLAFRVLFGSASRDNSFLDAFLLPLGYCLSFCLTHHMVAFSKSDASQHSSADSANAGAKKITVRPGKWSLATCIFVVAGRVAIYRYDPCVLFENLPSLNWGGARISRLVKRNLECDIFAINYSSRQSGAGLGVEVKLNADSPSNVLWPVDRKNIDKLFISNNQSHIDFAFLGSLDSVDFRMGELSKCQIKLLKENDISFEASDVLLADSRDMNSAVILGTHWRTNLYQVFCENDVRPNVLELCTWPPVERLEVSNNRRQVDYGMVVDAEIVVIEGGEITAEQIKDLGNSVEDVHLYGVQMIGSDRREKTVFNGERLIVHHEQPSSFLVELMQVIDFENSEFEFHIETNFCFTEQEMEYLVRVAKDFEIDIRFNYFAGDVGDYPRVWEQVMQLSMCPNVYFDAFGIAADQRNYSMALMVAGAQFNLRGFNLATGFNASFPFLNNLEDNPHWIYSGNDESRDALKVFFPVSHSSFIRGLSDDVSKITALSMDPNWCGFQTNWSRTFSELYGRSVVSLEEALAEFTGLREIYLTEQHRIVSLDFLQELDSLEKLQIDLSQVHSTNSNGTMAMPTCPSIKELTLLAAPKKSIVDGFKISVPNLKRLVVVDNNQEYRSFLQEKKRLEKELPGVVVEIYDPTQIDKLVPQEFKDHIEKLRQEIRDSMQRRNVDSDNGSEKPSGKR